MKLFEIYFWNALFWLMYLPTSLIIYFITWSGTVLGFMGIGFACTILLTLILIPMEDLLFEDGIPRPSPRRKNPTPSRPQTAPAPKQKPTEVKPHEENKKPIAEKRTPPEPGKKMRTDVDLTQLDADDDLSS